jgi:hypothetical protein
MVYDYGDNPKDVDVDSSENHANVRQELGLVLYVSASLGTALFCDLRANPLFQASNVLGSRGPRKMKVRLSRCAVITSRLACSGVHSESGRGKQSPSGMAASE